MTKIVGEEIKCPVCEKIFHCRKKSQKYCTEKCQKESHRTYFKHEKNIDHGLTTGSLGAVAELRVSADLLLKGYAIFRSLSQSCTCDLVLLMRDKLFRIEVTTGNVSKCGNKIYHPKGKKNSEKYDILAIVLKNGEIFYEPALPDHDTDKTD